jgi:epoxyqueuosine reductase QueG
MPMLMDSGTCVELLIRVTCCLSIFWPVLGQPSRSSSLSKLEWSRQNARDSEAVAREWALAYVETNDLIGRITDHLVDFLRRRGFRAAGEPATGNFDRTALVSRWSHKSVGVIAGLGSFGLHHMVITDAGCAGRFGSLVTDANIASTPDAHKERCLHFFDGSCRACVDRCPIDALSETGSFRRQACWDRCLQVAEVFAHLGTCEVCGKCAIGPCSFRAPA